MAVEKPITDRQRSLAELTSNEAFTQRHIGPDAAAQHSMLSELGLNSIDELMTQTVPESIYLKDALTMDEGKTEQQALAYLKELADQNTVNRSYIGTGYYHTYTPNVILRNILENPGWYTAYTPYQPEISQGRLEMLLNFQQMVMDLTGMEIANASLLDEATAAAEAMTLCRRSNRSKHQAFFVADDVHPQTIDVIKTRADYLGIPVVVGNPETELDNVEVFGVQLQYPGTYGDIANIEKLVAKAKAQKAMVSVATDLLALMLLKSPGELGADVVIGSSQRFGVPMGFGGPHAAFLAASEKLKRSVPGRIIGVSKDSRGNQALRMAMQTREQHIRREKATSNICTAQALLANMAAAYAIYHGPEGLKMIAERVHRSTSIVQHALTAAGFETNETYFDTLTVKVGDKQETIYQRALESGCNLRLVSTDRLGLSLDETTTAEDIADLFRAFTEKELNTAELDAAITGGKATGIADDQRRSDAVLTHPTFNSYHSETDMLRYLKRLENKDYSLTHGMIPLGSCTMKLNATAQMIPVTWNGFANVHPFAPKDQVRGYETMIRELGDALVEITGYDNISMQPNSGAQGEYAGLLAIRNYQQANDEGHRNICLIPSSAHGTNPASASMLDMKVVIVACDENGNVDVDDLRAKAEKHADHLSALMVTYPSTHGVFEEQIREVCQIVHDNGGQVYMDGANMNAQVGVSKPGDIGSDVSHLNLHKTFAIPHGGGGPGMGPIGVKAHLAPYLPNHVVSPLKGDNEGIGAVAAAQHGSAAILPISWMYCVLLGKEGLRQSTEMAILNANYMTEKLSAHYPVLYRGRNNKVAHECIVDIRPIKEESGISEEDIAKRLMDYGFHAPTMSFPVAGTLMIEPTESESKHELDRFIEAMTAIREEIRKVQDGEWPLDNNPLVNAPHTMVDLASAEWDRPYSREEAVFPSQATRASKYWPTVNRVDNVYGDRHFICSCPSIETYQD
ncbi:aminomethyl-transferring glycine dehydrogenase [Sansalvadorimonas verongulae]|uniref:aminomethyl-transferring glycine dehydrogenase n=1 Tax=Sansalvadorimonas verongulae TaxID=2172824 RepID=UPI0012BBE76B|nr:aminomethyl-transferring glycine dehydrogenase [Sansalvadorimonas verongulae]MTI12377.1 glycine dehydrogenase (aminomethyl-transferring) [Sansalvadorimonas verongulae]